MTALIAWTIASYTAGAALWASIAAEEFSRRWTARRSEASL